MTAPPPPSPNLKLRKQKPRALAAHCNNLSGSKSWRATGSALAVTTQAVYYYWYRDSESEDDAVY